MKSWQAFSTPDCTGMEHINTKWNPTCWIFAGNVCYLQDLIDCPVETCQVISIVSPKEIKSIHQLLVHIYWSLANVFLWILLLFIWMHFDLASYLFHFIYTYISIYLVGWFVYTGRLNSKAVFITVITPSSQVTLWMEISA